MSKIQLELGGKYSAGEMFQRAQEDIKQFGRANKDAIKAGTDSLKELQRGFDTDLGGAVSKTKGIIQGLAQGGLWGAIGAAAGVAIGAVVDWFKKAKEEAAQLAKYVSESVVNSIKGLAAEYQKTQEDIKKTQQAAEDALGVLNGQRAANLENRIYEIHTQTLQKVTDDMSEKGKAVVFAEEKLQVALEKKAFLEAENADKSKAANQKIADASDNITRAIEAADAAYKEYAHLSFQNSEVIGKRLYLQEQIKVWEDRYKEGLISYSDFQEEAGSMIAKKTKLEQENADTLKAYDEAYAGYLGLVEKIKEAEAAKVKATQELAVVEAQNAASSTQAQKAIDDAKFGVTQAQKALKDATEQETQKKKEREAEREATFRHKQALEQEQIELLEAENAEKKQNYLEALRQCWEAKLDEARFTRIYNQQIVQGIEGQEAIDNARRLCQAEMVQETKIIEACKKAKVEEKEYIARFNKLISDGFDVTEAFSRVQKELNDQLEKRTEAEKTATDQTTQQNEADKDPEGKGKKKLVVTMTASSMADLGEQAENKFSFKDWQKKNREEQRKVRDAKNNLKIDQAKMTKALKGEMPKAEAEEWMKYAKSKYTPDQMRELGKLAMNKELLSKREQQRQLAAVEKMAKEIAKSLTIK